MCLVLYLVLVLACRVHPLQPGPTRHTWPVPHCFQQGQLEQDGLCRHLAFNEQKGSTCYIPMDPFLVGSSPAKDWVCVHVHTCVPSSGVPSTQGLKMHPEQQHSHHHVPHPSGGLEPHTGQDRNTTQ